MQNITGCENWFYNLPPSYRDLNLNSMGSYEEVVDGY